MSLNGVMVLACTFFGVLAFVSPLIGRWGLRAGVALALDFWMAAGLIRLSGVPSWNAIVTAATLIVIRKTTNVSLGRFGRSKS
jgi:hypothetical protein